MGISGLFFFIGSYNAFVINSQSDLLSDQITFGKRLDESLGITTPGRSMAGAKIWKKLTPVQVARHQAQVIIQEIKSQAAAPELVAAPPVEEKLAAIKEDINLQLVEVLNPQKWQTGLTKDKFSGNLTASHGAIENFTFSIPDQDVSISFAEMTGNVFNYDLNGEIYSAMIFQADQHTYMVTMTNGPLEGTRMRFSAPLTQEQAYIEETLIVDHNVEIGQFGEPQAFEQAQVDTQQIENYDQNLQVEGFNMGAETI